MRIGSLCTGYGGLDMAVRDVLGGEVAWHCQYEPPDKNGREDVNQYAAQILAHHWPDVPNHGDLTTTDWSTVEPVDVLTAGFPCQPVSNAGLGAGTADERWLFDDICRAIRNLDTRPRLLVFENVPGLLTNNNGDAMARVVHGLAALGYVGTWRTVAAADVGAPHLRKRVFVVAWPADTPRPRLEARWEGRLGGGAVADAAGERHQRRRLTRNGRPGPAHCGDAAADSAGDGRDEGRTEPARIERGSDAAVGGRATAADTDGGRLPRRPERHSEADRAEGQHQHAEFDFDGPGVVWGPYAAAIARWEHILGRPAPAPTEPNNRGGGTVSQPDLWSG